MGTIMNKLALLKNTKEAIRQAIINKGQSLSATEPFSTYPSKIAGIQTGVDTSDATASAGDILSGKTAYGADGKLTGTIVGRDVDSLTASGATVTVPAGHYPSQVSKSVAAATQATPGITVSSSGLITASATQSAGYVAAGTKSATKQLTTQAAATITPGTSAKTAVAAGRYTTGAVTVAGSSNLVASNIKSGVNIFGVTGSLDAIQTPISCTIVNQTSIQLAVIYRATYEQQNATELKVLSGNSVNIVTQPGCLVFVEPYDIGTIDAIKCHNLGSSSTNCLIGAQYRTYHANAYSSKYYISTLIQFKAAGVCYITF